MSLVQPRLALIDTFVLPPVDLVVQQKESVAQRSHSNMISHPFLNAPPPILTLFMTFYIVFLPFFWEFLTLLHPPPSGVRSYLKGPKAIHVIHSRKYQCLIEDDKDLLWLRATDIVFRATRPLFVLTLILMMCMMCTFPHKLWSKPKETQGLISMSDRRWRGSSVTCGQWTLFSGWQVLYLVWHLVWGCVNFHTSRRGNGGGGLGGL